MAKHRFNILAAAMIFTCVWPTHAQSTRPASPKLPHIRIDTNARTVELDATVVLREGPLELLACFAGKKKHESILSSDARPSHIHASLLALGLLSGRTGHWTDGTDTPQRFIPPAGAALDISVRYTDGNGEIRTVDPRLWIRSIADNQPATNLKWIFVGSRPVGSGQYPADRTGETISVANFANALIDVPFSSSTEAAQLAFEAAGGSIPPLGTTATLIIQPADGAERADVARAVFEIDRFGRYRLDGLSIKVEQIGNWAESFTAAHKTPYVVIRPDPRSMVFDLQQLRSVLAEAQIRDIELIVPPLTGEALPRTPQKAAEGLSWWAKQFDSYADRITNPGESAEAALRGIDARRAELAAMLEMWTAYRQGLADALKSYRKAVEDRNVE